jgi:hypothetical protein
MNEVELVQDIALIGLGGAGIRTMLALRALIARSEAQAVGGEENSCRLLAIDSNYFAQDYFRDADEVDRVGVYLSQDEYLGLLRNGENPWDKVNEDAQSNIPEAVRLISQRGSVLINRAPDRNDYEAMIYVSRQRMKKEIRDFLKTSEGSNEKPAAPLRLIIASSLFGDTGSLSYLALLEMLTELSEEIRFESINTVLFAPEGFGGFFHLNSFHTAKYLSVINSISSLCFTEVVNQVVPIQNLVTFNPEALLDPFPRVFGAFTETAKKLHALIYEEPDYENGIQNDEGNSVITIVSLNLSKCLEIKKIIMDRYGNDRYFAEQAGLSRKD